MTTIKTAVSIEKELFNQAEDLAEELQVSRSGLVTMALERLIRDYQTKKLVEKLNEVYADGLDEEEQLAMEGMRRLQADLLVDEEW
jgi:metal-responsive CopG/Arc/MetJ family transcriptional regulator